MRITAIELENFKGISDRVRVELKPITLLFGANSAGKSTILQALQYFREILERRNANPDHTLYGGEFVDLGGFRNLVHQRDIRRRIIIKLDLALDGSSLPDLVPDAFDEWQTNDDEVWKFYDLLQETRGLATTVSIQLVVAWSAARKEAVVVGYEIGLNGAWLAHIEATEDARDASIRFNSFNPIFMRDKTDEQIEQEMVLQELMTDWIRPQDMGLSTEMEELPAHTDEDSDVDEDDIDPDELRRSPPGDSRRYSIFPDILSLVQATGMDKPGVGLRRWLTGFDSAMPHLSELLTIPTSGVAGAENIYIAREFTTFLSSLVIGPGELARQQLRQLRYLGPIRNVPARDFQPSLTPDEGHWADGTAAWYVLLSDNTLDEGTPISASGALLYSVSRWMSDPGRLNTGYEVERETYREVDNATLTALSRAADPDTGTRYDPSLAQAIKTLPEKRRLFLVDIRGHQRMVAKDVGIGISQVLPVVVAALEPSASLVCIEQPELHIHPAIQVGLGDLFIEGALKRGTQFLIETHSEHLILRLLRRVRETTDGELPPGLPEVKPEHIGVLYVDSGEGGMRITQLPIDETGEFTVRWPKGFFVERGEELF